VAGQTQKHETLSRAQKIDFLGGVVGKSTITSIMNSAKYKRLVNSVVPDLAKKIVISAPKPGKEYRVYKYTHDFIQYRCAGKPDKVFFWNVPFEEIKQLVRK